MQFKKLAICMIAALALLVGGSAQVMSHEAPAGPGVPNVVGTWNIRFEGYCMPEGYERGRETMVITEQTGSVFVGYWQYPGGQVPFTGAIAGREIRITDAEGVITGTLIKGNTMVGTASWLGPNFCTDSVIARRAVVE